MQEERMEGTPRDRARARTMADIIRIGRQQLASDGAAALSLRAVARDLGVVSSAVYRYVASRDELLTLLVVAGYDELGDAVDEALGALAEDAYRERLTAIATAVREWAVREPAMYALLFGSPVPGYHAPAERTVEPGTRVIRALVGLWAQAYAAGALRLPEGPPVPASLSDAFVAVRAELGVDLPDQVMARGVLAWAALFGCISFEVFGQYGPDTFGDPAALFDHQVHVLAETVGLA